MTDDSCNRFSECFVNDGNEKKSILNDVDESHVKIISLNECLRCNHQISLFNRNNHRRRITFNRDQKIYIEKKTERTVR